MSDDVELPRKDVAHYLAGKDLKLCAQYLEYLMEEKQETSALYHNWLAETYLDMAMAARQKRDEGKRIVPFVVLTSLTGRAQQRNSTPTIDCWISFAPLLITRSIGSLHIYPLTVRGVVLLPYPWHLTCSDFFEARAILLGRLEKHDAALDIYVNRLYNYNAAEEYSFAVLSVFNATDYK